MHKGVKRISRKRETGERVKEGKRERVGAEGKRGEGGGEREGGGGQTLSLFSEERNYYQIILCAASSCSSRDCGDSATCRDTSDIW